MSSLYLYYGNQPVTLGGFGNVTTPVTTGSQWIRPSDWLTMPDTSSMTGSVGKFVGLLAVPTGSGNFVALSATNDFYIDWGDGTSGSYAANATAQNQYNYDNLPSSSYSSGSNGAGGAAAIGYRQVLITITPSGSGVNMTGINLQKKHSQSGLPSIPDTNWLEIAVGGNNITSINNIGGGTIYLRWLERANIANISSSITNFTTMFQNCYSLQSVPLFNTANGTNFTNMFQYCNSLQSVPLFNTANGTNFTTMFYSCYSLQSVPLFNTANGTNFTNMLYGCYSLQSVPLFNTANGTNFTNMFQYCNSLQSVPLFNTANGTNFTNMFYGCNSLQSVPLFNTANGTNFTNMFQYCNSLQSVPLFNTANGTNFTNMFNGCNSLQSVPLFNTANGTNFANMFQYCNSLQSVPLFNTANGTNFTTMFQYCNSLQSVPLFNTANGTNFANMFNGCNSLQSIPLFNMTNNAALTASGVFSGIFNQQCYNLQVGAFSGSRSTIDYTGCLLSYPAIVDIFNNLGITGSATIPCSITTSLNWGSSSLTPVDISIATNKGWAVKP